MPKKIFLPFLLILSALLANGAQLPPGFVEEKIAEGLDPTAMAIAPDGRVFIAEKNGRIRIVEDGQLLSGAFLQIEVDNYNERGLSGIVLSPSFEQDHFVYLFYTVPGDNYNRISRFTANGNAALPGSEQVLLELEPLAGTIHNGGSLHFGPDGMLYVTVGDGANAENGQNLNTTLGKVLRLRPDGSIPEDNPFYGQLAGNRRAIWAYGFRNPFSAAMQPGTGRLFLNDVGSFRFEEVNEVLPGRNYGWAGIEGLIGEQPAPDNYKDPLHAYDHGVGCSVIGAAFYNPASLQFPPRYHGKYFFGDYCQGFIKVLDPESGEILETFATNIGRPVALHTAPDGTMYYLERRGMGGGSETDNTSTSNGVLWRISFTGSGAPFIAEQPNSQLAPAGEIVSFRVRASGAPDLAYQWQKNGTGISGADGPELLVTAQLADDGSRYRCRVSNGEGTVLSEEALLTVTANTRPVAHILTPSSDDTYRAGDTLFFSGTATDAEDGTLGPENMVWRIDFHHDEHSHPAMAPTAGIGEGFYLIPTIGETDDNVWYRVYLTAEDGEGLSQRTFRDVFPEKASITVNTEPPGLQIRVDGQTFTAPHTFNSVIGILRSVRAPATQSRGDTFYGFQQWTDGQENGLRSFLTPEAGLSLTAVYEPIPRGTGSGLTGAYYDEVEHTFQGNPAFWRIDTVVNFNWGGGSAAPMLIGEDFYSIRWTGSVEAQFSEIYTFYIISDDGVRLWVDDELIIGRWVPQPPTETQGSIFMEAGKRYSIRLEYFEDAGGAACQLFWSSPGTNRAVVPKLQLYPDLPSTAAEENGKGTAITLFPQPATEQLHILLDMPGPALLQARLFHIDGREVWRGLLQHNTPLSRHAITVEQLAGGLYVLQLGGEEGKRQWVRKVIIR